LESREQLRPSALGRVLEGHGAAHELDQIPIFVPPGGAKHGIPDGPRLLAFDLVEGVLPQGGDLRAGDVVEDLQGMLALSDDALDLGEQRGVELVAGGSFESEAVLEGVFVLLEPPLELTLGELLRSEGVETEGATDQIEGAAGLTLELLVAGLEALVRVFKIAFDEGLVLVEAEGHDGARVGEGGRETERGDRDTI
jgi:hypothetical protein